MTGPLFVSIPNHKKLKRNGCTEIFLFASNLGYFRSETGLDFGSKVLKRVWKMTFLGLK